MTPPLIVNPNTNLVPILTNGRLRLSQNGKPVPIVATETIRRCFIFPDILEAAVVGIPNPKWGETVKAYIVIKPGKQMTEEQVIQFCQSSIASYKNAGY